MSRSTQCDRVLAALYLAGARGITCIEFDAPNVCDGGEPIKRLAARVNELREAGFEIETAGTRNKCAVYRIVRTGTLFDTPALELGGESSTAHWREAA